MPNVLAAPSEPGSALVASSRAGERDRIGNPL
jgi:hypothetical protein